jgi:hypothetical protein
LHDGLQEPTELIGNTSTLARIVGIIQLLRESKHFG